MRSPEDDGRMLRAEFSLSNTLNSKRMVHQSHEVDDATLYYC
jgi:hypothetical protein